MNAPFDPVNETSTLTAVKQGMGQRHGTLNANIVLQGLRIIEVVGVGGFGIVYRAWDLNLEREVALKEYFPRGLCQRGRKGQVVPPSAQAEPEDHAIFQAGLKSFVNEARLLAQFDHAALVQVFRFWEGRGTAYMVMPFYKGRTLHAHWTALPESARSGDRAWRLLKPIAEALHCMHQRGCLHRDVSPDNVLIQEEGEAPILLDFGAARRTIEQHHQGLTVIVRAGFAPIEQYAEYAQGSANQGQGTWTDVYGLCAVLYWMMRGTPPPAAAQRWVSDAYRPLADDDELAARFDLALRLAVDSGLALQAALRPQTLEELTLRMQGHVGACQLLETLDAELAKPSTLVQTPSWRTRWRSIQDWLVRRKPVQKSSKPNRAVVLAAIGLLAGAVWVAGWWPHAEQEPSPEVIKPSWWAATPLPPPVTDQTLNNLGRPVPQWLSSGWLAEQGQRLLNELGSENALEVDVNQDHLRLGKDPIELSIASRRDGVISVWVQSPDGSISVLTPTTPALLSEWEKIRTGEKLLWPNPFLPLVPSDLPGTYQVLVLLSREPIDWSTLSFKPNDTPPSLKALPNSPWPPCHKGHPCPTLTGVWGVVVNVVKE